MVEAFIQPAITSIIPSQNLEIDEVSRNHFEKLNLADPSFNTARSVDFIIGADYYVDLIKPNVIKIDHSSLVAQLSIFGWLIIGPIPKLRAQQSLTEKSSISLTSRALNVARCLQVKAVISEPELDELLKLFWVQEEIPSEHQSDLSFEEQECEDHFKNTHTRNDTGRYIVRIPLKDKIDLLGNSYTVAHHCLQRTTKRLTRGGEY